MQPRGWPILIARGSSLLTAIISLGSVVGCGDLDAFDAQSFAIGKAHRSLSNGREENGFPSVGRLRHGQGSSSTPFCTATLVGDRTVLTAAHCVKDGALQFELSGELYAVASAEKHRDFSDEDDVIVNDIAVLRLATMPDSMPSTLCSDPPKQGQIVTLVGFGATTAGTTGMGAKRSATHPVSFVTDTELFYDGSASGYGNICNGDSGGPTFKTTDAGKIQVGVHSSMVGECGSSGQDTRVDVFLDWIAREAGGDIYRDGKRPIRDRSMPLVRIARPQEGAIARTDLVVDAQVSDTMNIAAVHLEVDGKRRAVRTAPPFTFSVNALTPGVPTALTVVAEDAAGNRGQDTVIVKPDLLAPDVKILEPTEGSAVNANTVVRVAVSDDDRVASLTLKVEEQQVRTRETPPWDFRVNLRYRVNHLTIVATDAAGNSATSTVRVLVHGAPEAPSSVAHGGCTLVGGAEPSALAQPIILALLFFCACFRRRRR